MPQSRSGGSRGSGASRSSSGGGARRARSTSSRSTAAKRSTAGKRSTAAKRTTAAKRSTAAKRTTAKRSTTSSRSRAAKPKPGSPEARVEAAANRVRKLNEQIIAAGREAGETTLTNYEKFLKSIAGSLERGPGKSDVEWISNLAQAQAKFIRDVTASLTKAARKRLK
jgi:DNA-binding protein HU-beta